MRFPNHTHTGVRPGLSRDREGAVFPSYDAVCNIPRAPHPKTPALPPKSAAPAHL